MQALQKKLYLYYILIIQVYGKYGGRKVFFRTCTLEEAVNGTDLAKPAIFSKVINSPKKMVHISDVLR